MLSNILGNVLQYLGEYCQILRGMPPSILESLLKHSGNVCVTRGNKGAGSVQDFIEPAVQNSAWNL